MDAAASDGTIEVFATDRAGTPFSVRLDQTWARPHEHVEIDLRHSDDFGWHAYVIGDERKRLLGFGWVDHVDEQLRGRRTTELPIDLSSGPWDDFEESWWGSVIPVGDAVFLAETDLGTLLAADPAAEPILERPGIVRFGEAEILWSRVQRSSYDAAWRAASARFAPQQGLAPATAARLGLAAFVVVWLFGPSSLRAVVPIWLPFLVALGLELQFFLTAWRAAPGTTRPDRRPQPVDQELYGFPEEPDDGEEDYDDYEAEDEDEEPWTPEPEPEPAPTVPMRGLVLGLAVIVALAGLAWYVDSRSGWAGLDDRTQALAEERFSQEAARIAGHEVEIRCDESGERVGFVQHTDGVAEVGGRLAYLAPDRCHELYRLAFDGHEDAATGRAIAVLAHEAWHLRGVRDEGITQCYALQSGVELGQRLGLGEDDARRLMRRELVANAGRGTSFEYRVGPECRDGGELDLDPAADDFP